MFPVVRSLLLPDALLSTVQRTYALDDVERCVLLRSLVNDVYEVATPARQYVLKVYRHGWRSTTEVGWELELIAHLAERGVPLAPAVPGVDGRLIGTLQAPEGIRPFVLFDFVEGAKPQLPFNAELYHDLGKLAARIHQASNDFRSQYSRQPLDLAFFLDRSLSVIFSQLVNRPEDQLFVAHLAVEVRHHIRAFSSQGLEWGICHGDITLDNVHITSDRNLIIHDFDMSGEGWRASDLYGVRQADFWDAFLRGYTELRSLTTVDLQAVPWFIVVRELYNLRFQLAEVANWRGTLSHGEDYIDEKMRLLRAAADALHLL